MSVLSVSSKREPDIFTLRERIESIKKKPVRMCVKYLYLIDGRISEGIGLAAPSDVGTVPRGPRARSMSFNEFEGEEVVIFEVNTAKRGDDVRRMCALPYLFKYEPWTKEVVDYFDMFDDNDLVFPFNRQKAWRDTKPFWEDLWYKIDPYSVLGFDAFGDILKDDDGKNIIRKVEGHWKEFSIHGTRHIRTGDLVFFYGFTPADLSAIGGWSLGTSMRATRTMRRYIQYDWRSYVAKLFKQRY